MYQALYRKWRPRSFDDVVGQAHVTDTLKRQIETGRLSHAYLFVGTRGTGKTTCAKILAKAANCEHPINGNPCNECPSCLGIDSGAILDVEELDAASNNGVENIRALRDEAIYSPAEVRRRVYIVDEVHMLTMQAFNALLKILEEPPEHLIFILATTELQKVPATILSRCQRFSFKRLTPSETEKRLQYVSGQEHMELTDGAAQLLARLADGSMRDALSLLDQCRTDGTIDENRVREVVGIAGAFETAELFKALAGENAEKALSIFDRLYFGGKSPSALIRELIALERDMLVTMVAPKSGDGLLSGAYDRETLSSFAALKTEEGAVSDIHMLQDALSDIGRGADGRICAEICLISLCSKKYSQDISALRARVAELENRLQRGFVPAAEERRAEAEEGGQAASAGQQQEGPASVEQNAADAEKADPTGVSEGKPATPGTTRDAGDLTDFAAQWQRILDASLPQLGIPVNMFLKDEAYTSAGFDGKRILISAANDVTKNMIGSPEVLAIVRTSAERILGRSVAVMVETRRESDESKEKKLESLKRFGNVQFK